MLARSGPLPTAAGYAYELKFDGFRALASQNGRRRVVSRRGWDMTGLLPELEVPEGVTLDGELIAFGDDRLPSFPRLCDRRLQGRRGIDVVFVAFDLLHQGGESTQRLPYRERRHRLEQLGGGEGWSVAQSYDDGEALWRHVCGRGLEGVVAKRLSGTYQPGRRGWVKIKNRGYWRYPLELEAVRRSYERKAAGLPRL
jgi:bifunctional non-homologous end joining protein LigD